MKKMTKRMIALGLAAMMILGLTPGSLAEGGLLAQVRLEARVKNIITVDNLQFKDLNDNGELDPYEDWRLSPEERADDLLGRMSAAQKAAQMAHPTLRIVKNNMFSDSNVGFALVYEYIYEAEEPDEDEMEDYIPVSDAQNAARLTNELQELSESSELGIPVILSMDTEIGAAHVKDATFLPDEINQGAVNDPDLVYRLNEVLREEMMAVGVRMALSPDADLMTDPRWGRTQECYSEDTEVVQSLIVAAVQALQGGDTLTPQSVIATVKHFPGSGAQENGKDASPLTIQADSLELHLAGFKAAIAAGAAAVMPYGYSTVPFLGGDAVEKFADQSSVVMTDLLRGELGYTGIIQTDWGSDFIGSATSGADILGGASARDAGRVASSVDEERINDACRRILIAKFQMGLFENPYVDEEAADAIVGSEEHKAVAKEAAARSFTLVKYENPAALAGQEIIVAGALAENVRALNSGWTAKEPAEVIGDSILAAIQRKAGEENVTYIPDAEAVPADLTGRIAVVVVGEKSNTHNGAWGDATLEFPGEQADLVKALNAAGANVITVVIMSRAYVLTEIARESDTVFLAYRPGVTVGASAVADALFGETPITGRTPFQIPRSMDQVLAQREDLPKDIVDPLYEYGFGIDVESFGR